MYLDKINNCKIREEISSLKENILKNYDLIWLMEQALNPGAWEIYQQASGENRGFLIKRNDLYWANPKSGEEMELFYKLVKKELPVYVHCYEKWVSSFIEDKEYKVIKNENIYLACNKDSFKGRKKTRAILLDYETVNSFQDKWFSLELIDFLRQNQKVYGLVENDDTLVGWCFIDTLTKGVAEVYRLEIHPMRRRRGFAADILSKALEEMFHYEEQVMFNLKITNEAALELIKKIGFKEVQREYRYLVKGN